MPFALVTLGLLMIVTGARDTYKQFGEQVTSDFTGSGGFLYWVAAIGAVGALGYVPSLRTFSRVFMGLIIIALVLNKKNSNLFANITAALQQGPANIQSDATTSSTTATSNVTQTPFTQYNFSNLLQGQAPPAPGAQDFQYGGALNPLSYFKNLNTPGFLNSLFGLNP